MNKHSSFLRCGARRLDQVLNVYEQVCAIEWFQAHMNLARNPDPDKKEVCSPGILNGDKLRSTILSVRPFMEKNGFESLLKAHHHNDKDHVAIGPLVTMPALLSAWTAYSRRDFALSKNAQSLIEGTSLGKMRWMDIEFPFNCFLISLEEPIVYAEQKVRIDALLVYVADKDFYVVGFSEGLEDYQILSEKQKAKITGDQAETVFSAIVQAHTLQNLNLGPNMRFQPVNVADIMKAKNTLEEASRLLVTLRRKVEHMPLIAFASISIDDPTQEVDLLLKKQRHTKESFRLQKAIADYDIEFIDQVNESLLRIAIVFALYMENRDHARSLISVARPVSLKYGQPGKSRTISQLADVCEVKSTIPVPDLAEVRKRSGTGSSPSAHYRRFHKRRPPGQGSNPAHPKSVKVTSTIVNQNKLRDNELAVGAAAMIE